MSPSSADSSSIRKNAALSELIETVAPSGASMNFLHGRLFPLVEKDFLMLDGNDRNFDMPQAVTLRNGTRGGPVE